MKRGFADHFWWRLSDPARRTWPRLGPEPIQRGPGNCTCGRTVEDCDRTRRGEPLTTPDAALVWLALQDLAKLLEMARGYPFGQCGGVAWCTAEAHLCDSCALRWYGEDD